MDILEPILIQALDNAFSLGLLVAAVWWFKKRDEKKDADIAGLNKEYRDSMERNLNKSNEAIVNNTMALTAIREALKNA